MRIVLCFPLVWILFLFFRYAGQLKAKKREMVAEGDFHLKEKVWHQNIGLKARQLKKVDQMGVSSFFFASLFLRLSLSLSDPHFFALIFLNSPVIQKNSWSNRKGRPNTLDWNCTQLLTLSIITFLTAK